MLENSQPPLAISLQSSLGFPSSYTVGPRGCPVAQLSPPARGASPCQVSTEAGPAMGCCNSKLPPQTACYHDGSNETPETETSEVMSSDDEAAGSQLVLTLLSASNMPRLDLFSASDIYAVAFLQVDGEPRPPRVTWPVKADATNPVWNSSRLLGCAEEGAVVVVDFYDHDESAAYDVTKLSGSRPDFIGRAVLPVADLPVGGGSVEALLELPRRSLSLSSLRRALQPPGHPPACTLARVAPSMLRGPRRKVVYLIRHGESLWNEVPSTLRPPLS